MAWSVYHQVFIVDVKASKKQIKDAVSKMYDIQTKKINTLIRCVRGTTKLVPGGWVRMGKDSSHYALSAHSPDPVLPPGPTA